MAESETTTDTTEGATATQTATDATHATDAATADAAMPTVIDLRAPQGAKRELYRLGLRFAYAQDALEVWEDGVRGVRATFTPGATDGILLEDTATHVTDTVTLAQLTAATMIETMTGGAQ